METTRLNIRFIDKIINNSNDSNDSYIIELFTIKNNALLNIEIQCHLEKNIETNELKIELHSYITNNNTCNLCNHYEQYRFTNPTLCKCKKKRVNLNIMFDKIIKSENINISNHTTKGIQDKIELLSIDILEFINLIKLCNKCDTYIYNNTNLCGNCLWQDKYNQLYGEILKEPCSICYNTIYITEAVTKCGNFAHSIHKLCDKQLRNCPICRGTNNNDDDDDF